MPKKRLDILLAELGFAESRSQAERLVMAGKVRVNGQIVLKPSAGVAPDANLEVEIGPRFVSRGGEKLAAALKAFELNVSGRVCADVGSSTGGFTDCLLQSGALRVYAIDVGKGILDWRLRNDPRVIVVEKTNARYLTSLPEPIGLATLDVSFISLKLLFPVVAGWFGSQSGEAIPLIKPQFEAGRAQVARGRGVVRDVEIHRRVLLGVLESALQAGYHVQGLIRSPLTGPKGNAEFLAHLSYNIAGAGEDIEDLVDGVIQDQE